MANGEYRNLSNQEYWIKRSEEVVDKHWKDIKNVEKEMAKQYRIALEDIRQMVIDLFTKYAKENALSYKEAIKNLTQAELGDYQAKIARLRRQIEQTQDPFLIAEMEKLQKAAKLNRLQALLGQIMARLLQLGYEQQNTIMQWLVKVFKSNYYQTIYQLQVGTGLGIGFAQLNEAAVKEAITHPWSGDMFSDRIWDNKNALVRQLRQTITQGLIKGLSVQKMAKEIKNAMNNSYSNALRLVRTETAYVIGESTYQGYKQSGYMYQYIYLATLDSRTSPICRKLDNKVYKLEEKQVGVNYPPLHPNCRSAVAPYFNGDELKESVRIARGEGKETYYVPANMTYAEWHKQYVK
ncbi:minor capsid protein [Neobacillus sedimentimangrovi]|uniref:Minor capsid protein n=1 Tax=Neobacillus sedimentimangrovi TaxID=2699460 RepID=A0ABS8QKC4_9BACI|nr:minor capsid protein [Neobacillus sedimentimangrovi]MCD4839738.1 minor capsid protein [Neobacillus sedimentimangrovi]